MIKILKGSRFAVISHRFQQLISIMIWGFHIFSNSRRIMIRSKSSKWKWKAYYSNNQTIGYKKKRGCWFTHFTMTTVSLSYQLGWVGFGFGRDSDFWVWVFLLRSWAENEERQWRREEKKEGIVKNKIGLQILITR